MASFSRAVLAAALTTLTVAGLALDAAAASRACITTPPTTLLRSFTLVPVIGTFGFIFPTSCPTSGGPYHVTPGVAPCPASVGPQPGQYCGPVIPPGGQAFCTWFTFYNNVPTGMYAGFDYTGDGNVFTPGSGEHVEGPIPQFPMGSVINNPTASPPGRLIAYPTNTASQMSAPNDINLVSCS